MKKDYTLYLYYDDIRLLKHKTNFDSWELFYHCLSEPFIKDSMSRKENLATITIACRLCLSQYLDYVKKGYTLSWDECKLVLCSYFTLYKFNKISDDNIILIKNKSSKV